MALPKRKRNELRTTFTLLAPAIPDTVKPQAERALTALNEFDALVGRLEALLTSTTGESISRTALSEIVRDYN